MPVELPGRGARLDEIRQENCLELTEMLYREIADAAPRRYALFGHSMGALLAFGVAQRLHAQQLPLPAALLVAGCAAPSRQDSERYRQIRGDAALIAELGKQGGTPEEVFNNPELLAMTLDLLRVDYRVCGSFQYDEQASLPVSVHCFGGRADDIKPERLDEWRRESNRRFTLDWFDGGHFFLRQSEEWFIHVLTKRLLESRIGAVRDFSATA